MEMKFGEEWGRTTTTSIKISFVPMMGFPELYELVYREFMSSLFFFLFGLHAQSMNFMICQLRLSCTGVFVLGVRQMMLATEVRLNAAACYIEELEMI